MDAQSLSNLRKYDMPASFLSLAPASSRTGRIVPAAAERPSVSRASSLSSEGSTSSTSSLRILKLAPVQQGEHVDSHKQDWHELAMDGGLGQNDMPASFLSLAPASSRNGRIVPAAAERPSASRSSSLSSEGSAASFRILKLAPVQQGEHVDSHKQDWHDVFVFE